MDRYDHYKRKLMIDKHSLDTELESHSHIYNEVGEELALANSRRDEAKENLALVDAGLFEDLVKPSEKVTIDERKSRIAQHEDHLDAVKMYSKLKLEADKWSALYESFRSRDSMIRKLADLYLGSYYSNTSITNNSHSADKVAAQKGRESMSRQRTRRDVD